MESHEQFLHNIKQYLPELRQLLDEINDHWCYEDLIYRFYHQSFKVYQIQKYTRKILEAFKKLAPKEGRIHPFLEVILKEGASEKQFDYEHNKDWLNHTRPMVEAFLHMRYFLEMAIKYGEKLESAPRRLPSGWAGLLYLFLLR